MTRWPYPPEFTIAFVVHGDVPLLECTVPTTIAALTEGTTRSYDLVLAVDGCESAPVTEILDRADAWGFDEIRLRRRDRHAASGDPSNNGHLHLPPAKGRYLICVEGDVAAFRCGPGDPLDQIATAFDVCPTMALATRIDDHACWQWAMTDVGPPRATAIRSVNRVASQFLIFDLVRYGRVIAETGGPPGHLFHDSSQRWFNFEDWLSRTFAAPAGPGIGYLDDLPLKVFHCDEKTAPGAATYTRRLDVRLRVFEQRRQECEQHATRH